jgi:potassium efflux system protein
MAIEQYRRRREAERRAATEEKPEEGGEEIPLQEEAELGLEEVSAQTLRLVRSAITVLLLIGLLGIWASVLPALGMLDQYALWMPSGATAMVDADGSMVLPPEAITVADVLLAMVIAFMTLAVSRNIPGVLEMLVLRRLPLDNGSRYAIRTLTRYAILIIGITITFGAIGIGWGKVQFLAAAVSVGLGFGLQEIFANFVSGLIILTERPVRVGDTVTVGSVSGVVSRIQMRATTVTDWDRKELIIPNKEFVTGQVTNWSLTNSVLRLKLLVGVAYGSDTATARRLLLEVAAKNPIVLANPAPAALFMEFADSSLNFELRVFIDQIDYMSVVRDQLNVEIDQAFRNANIEIAFPQRDIHIRSGDIVQPGPTPK